MGVLVVDEDRRRVGSRNPDIAQVLDGQHQVVVQFGQAPHEGLEVHRTHSGRHLVDLDHPMRRIEAYVLGVGGDDYVADQVEGVIQEIGRRLRGAGGHHVYHIDQNLGPG